MNTTLDVLTTPAPAPERIERYTNDILELNDRLSFRRLPDVIEGEPVWLRRRQGTPLTTVAALESQIPDRYLLGIYGFRLSQYLRLGWACPDTVYHRSLFTEPRHHPSPDDLHVITLDQRTGRILGYVSLAHGSEASGRRLGDPDRAPFPFEVAHRLRVQDELPDVAAFACDAVREVKRFVRDVSLKERELRARVPWELLLGLAGGLSAISPRLELLVGDLQESVALRHLLTVGMRTRLIEHTSPALHPGEVMRPMYVKRKSVKPFVAEIPPLDQIAPLQAFVDAALARPGDFRMLAAPARPEAAA